MAVTTGELDAGYSTGYTCTMVEKIEYAVAILIISKHDSVLSKLTNLYSHKRKICHDIPISDIKFL